MILPIEGDEASGWKPGAPIVFLNGSSNEAEPMFSPDGRWLAYHSNEFGQFEIYVRPFTRPTAGDSFLADKLNSGRQAGSVPGRG